jgi:hypothetical protein
MKRTITLFALAATIAACAASALAQAKECTDEFKSATYQKWYDNRKDHQDVAREAAKEYLATCTTEDQYSKALKSFADAYDALTAKANVNKQFEDAYTKKNYAEQIRIGKQIVASDPENSSVYLVMGLAGLGDANLINDSAESAKKAISLIEAGKPFAPLASKDQALAFLNYVIGQSTIKTSPADAIPFLLKAAKLESELKKNPQLYLDLARAYNEGPRAKQTEDYKVYAGKPETPESKLALANINQIIDRQIDALARAAALADAANKKAIMDALTEEYKDQHKDPAGLTDLVANILSKPIPDIPTPLTSLPSTSTTSPAMGGSSSGANGVTTPNTTGSAKPAPSPTPANKRPR